jgi:hypothetical protein
LVGCVVGGAAHCWVLRERAFPPVPLLWLLLRVVWRWWLRWLVVVGVVSLWLC